jgi:lysyl-tRNA synthetase, class II
VFHSVVNRGVPPTSTSFTSFCCREAQCSEQKQQKKQNKNHNPESGKSVDEIRELRAEKVRALREAGNEPFAYSFDRTALAAELQEQFKHIPDGQEAEGACQ